VLRLLLLLALAGWVPAAQSARVVTLSPHATELVWFAGGGEQLVGVAAFSDFPETVRQLPVIGDVTGIDRERLISLAPDLLVYWSSGIRPSDLAWLQERGIATFASGAMSIDGLVEELRSLGELLGTGEAAARSIRDIEQKRQALERLGTGDKRVRMIHQLWNRPLIVLGRRDLLPHALELCGIDNPVDIGDLASASVSREYLHALEADAILIGDDAFFAPFNPGGLPVYRSDSNRMHRPAPRLLDAALEICRAIRSANERGGTRDE
jgi:iron complex transport system substrate-binding protein